MNKSKILIIDDDKDVCKVLKDNLQEEGYDVSTANNGVDGLERIKKQGFDLAILDIKLPDITGDTVLKEIREFNKDIVVIVLTGFPSVDTAVGTLKDLASDYISKPFNINNLRAIIKKELHNRKAKEKVKLTEIKNIGSKIKQLRKQKNMSLDELAKKTDLSKSFLSELERSKKFPRLDTLQRIAEQLGTSAYFFISE